MARPISLRTFVMAGVVFVRCLSRATIVAIGKENMILYPESGVKYDRDSEWALGGLHALLTLWYGEGASKQKVRAYYLLAGRSLEE